MKKCNNCSEEKAEYLFNKDKRSKDGLDSWCRDCKKEHRNAYYKTKDGLLSKMYNGQRKRSKERSHDKPSYSKHELKDWLFSQGLFHELFMQWQSSGYKKMRVPSVDRIDNSKGYSLDNIQLMTWEENKQKGHDDTRSGNITHGVNPQTPVKAIRTLDGEEFEYISQAEAGRQTGIRQSDINATLKGKQKSAGGYRWEYNSKAWYEYPYNFPALLADEYKGFRKTTSKEHFIKLHRQGWKLATKEEVNSLYCEG